MKEYIDSMNGVFENAKSFIERRSDEPEKVGAILGIIEGLRSIIRRMDTDSPLQFHNDDLVYALDPEDGCLFEARYYAYRGDGLHAVRPAGGGSIVETKHVYPAFMWTAFEPVVIDYFEGEE